MHAAATLIIAGLFYAGGAGAQNMSGNGAPMSGMSGKEYRAALKACNAGPAKDKAQCRSDAKAKYKQAPSTPTKAAKVPKAPAQ
jgi:hypothetical protein